MKSIRYGKVLSCALFGIEGILVEIEVALLPGLPSFEIVGLGDSAVRESRNRVHAAIRNSGYEFPGSRLTASYAPAWLRKEGTAFDLALALAILIASGQIRDCGSKRNICVFGELSLTGQVRSLPGCICRAAACLENGIQELILPYDNYLEANSLSNCSPLPAGTLSQAADLYSGRIQIADIRLPQSEPESVSNVDPSNMEVVRQAAFNQTVRLAGQPKAVRALGLAAAGWHTMLLLGSSGCGKTTLARALPALLPKMTEEDAITVTRIHSAAGLLKCGGELLRLRPYFAPHHHITRAALIGGGHNPIPGLCSLAHRGVLFLDELTEYEPSVLDSLRQPLEEHRVVLSRLHVQVNWPSDFLMVAAANPCRCGEYFEPDSTCRCSSEHVNRHLNRISGPLLDRIDLTVEMTRLSSNELPACATGSGSAIDADMLSRISSCWQRQKARCRRHGLPEHLNGQIQHENLANVLELSDRVLKYAADSADSLRLSARSYIRVLRIARTIADFEDRHHVLTSDVAEALQYRLRKPGAG